jgi:hypothetical protein
MHFICISSPKLSSLFVLEQLKHSAEAIIDFDKNFALHMYQLLISTNIHNQYHDAQGLCLANLLVELLQL